jgi:tripartite-type tricarboxylate transporter receptor subunit TctC
MLRRTAGAAALIAVSPDARAEDYPTRPIRLVIPYAAGASGDQIGRPWVRKIESLLGPTYAENIGGAGGAIGSLAVAQSAPDGYSLLLGNVSTQVMIPLSVARPAYDTVRDFHAIYRLVTSALAVAVHPSLAAKDLQQLAAFATANPGKLSYGTPGAGTGNHLVGELFKQRAGAPDIVHLPYRGMGPAISDLIGGQILLIVSVVSAPLLELHHTGKLRILAVTSEQRLSGALDIPTVAESGMPDLRYAGWFGLLAPRATSRGIVDRIAVATRAAMSDPILQETYRSQGLEPDTDSSPDKFQQLIENDLIRLAPIITSIIPRRD